MKGLVKSQVPRPGEKDYRGFEWYFFKSQAETGPKTISQIGQVMSLDFSPDGIASNGREIYRINKKVNA